MRDILIAAAVVITVKVACKIIAKKCFETQAPAAR